MRFARTVRIATASLLALALFPAATSAPETGVELSEAGGMTLEANIPYGNRFGLRNNYGTDSHFTEMAYDVDGVAETDDVAVRDIGVFGSIGNGAFVMDVTDGMPVELAWYPCGIGQGDVQIFHREDERGTATYFTYTDDGYDRKDSMPCVAWAKANAQFGNGQGTYIVDMTNPRELETVAFVPFALGSHNMTVHPSGNYLYNSNSELITNVAGAAIEIFDMTDLTDIKPLPSLVLPQRPGLGTDSHDITFNADGTRAYSAALSQTIVINTEDPTAPVIISSFMDAAINVEHQANPVTITDPILGERDFLIVEDELAGAAGGGVCPSGGVHVYDITGDLEKAPVKVGVWNIDSVHRVAGPLTSCTAHVFDIHDEAGIMTMSFYGGGVRVIDIRGLVGVSLGGNGVGMKEIAGSTLSDSNSWSFKAAKVELGEDGTLDFYAYSNDINRGLDVYHVQTNIDTPTATSANTSQWMTPLEALSLGGLVLPADYKLQCMLANRI